MILGDALNPTTLGNEPGVSQCFLSNQDDSICPDPNEPCYTGQGPEPMVTCEYECYWLQNYTDRNGPPTYKTKYIPCGSNCDTVTPNF